MGVLGRDAYGPVVIVKSQGKGLENILKGNLIPANVL